MVSRRVMVSAGLLLIQAAVAGCDNHLETGYKFHPLSSTDDDRRAFYAPQYTPQSHSEHKDDQGLQLDQ